MPARQGLFLAGRKGSRARGKTGRKKEGRRGKGERERQKRNESGEGFFIAIYSIYLN